MTYRVVLGHIVPDVHCRRYRIDQDQILSHAFALKRFHSRKKCYVSHHFTLYSAGRCPRVLRIRRTIVQRTLRLIHPLPTLSLCSSHPLLTQPESRPGLRTHFQALPRIHISSFHPFIAGAWPTRVVTVRLEEPRPEFWVRRSDSELISNPIRPPQFSLRLVDILDLLGSPDDCFTWGASDSYSVDIVKDFFDHLSTLSFSCLRPSYPCIIPIVCR